MKRISCAIMLAILLTSMLTLAFNIQPVEANGTIYIRADGSIDPPTANITTADYVIYTFTGNIYDQIRIERGNITIDGNGYALQGSGSGNGFYWNGITNITIKNTNIKGFGYGIYLSNSLYNNIIGNNITESNYYGIYLFNSANNTVNENVVVDGEWGIILYDSGNNILRNNNMTDNDYNFGVGGSMTPVSRIINDIDTSNTVNGKPVYYLINQHDLIINPFTFPEIGYLGLVNSTNITVENLVMTHNRHGVLFSQTNGSTIRNVNVSDNYWGICLYAAVNNIIENVTATNNEYVGIQLYYSDNSVIRRSVANNTSSEGIRVYYSPGSTVSDNVVANNRYGMYVYRSSGITLRSNVMVNNTYGLYLSSSSYNNISRNTLASNGKQGIRLWYSSHNRISGNNMIGNHDGIELRSSSDNSIYHNNFVNNAIQVVTYGSINAWDDGYSSGGNFWGDYTGADANKDGIGDTPYVINENNADHYPLINPYGSFPTFIRNLDTNLTYLTIQSAINAPETLDGHTIFVKTGTYYEHVTVNKSVSLVGENTETTVIDGDRTGKVAYVTANNVTIMNLTLRRGDFGIFTDHTRYGQIIGNIVADNWRGIQLDYSTENTITENTVEDNYDNGINLWRSYNNTFRNNTITNTYLWNFDINGQENVFEYVNDLDTSNTVNGKPIYYLVNQHDVVVPNDAACVIAVNSTNITVENMNLTHNGRGVHFAFVTNSTIRNINASNNHIGLLLEYSTFITVADNNVTNSWRGVTINYSWNNTMTGNIVQDSYDKGIELWRSGNNTLTNNSILNTNLHNFRVYCDNLYELMNYVDESNTVNGKPIYYWINQENREIPSDAGYVAIVNSTNITVRNLNLTHNGEGVMLAYTNNSTIENVNASYNERSISLSNSHNNSITGNNVANSWRGIDLAYSTGNQLENNIVTDNDERGINLWRSYNNTLRNNTITNTNLWNFDIYGDDLSEYINDVDPSNTVNGKQIFYWINRNDEQIPLNAGYVAIINSTRIIVQDLTLTHNGEGVLFAYTTHSTIRNITMMNNEVGIYLRSSESNVLSGNALEDNSYGIVLSKSSDNTIENNAITNIGWLGIYVEWSSDNVFKENTVANCWIGFNLWSSNTNTIYRNNFVDNRNQVETGESVNTWNYDSVGNYWGDYTGADANKDGIGDTPNVINENNADYYPLIHPYGSILNLNTNLTYLTIQSAINAPETLSGHTISVRNGTYYENVIVNKTLMFVGESKERTTINGEGAGNTITVSADDVVIRGFTVTNSGGAYPDSGIFLNGVKNTIISDNNVTGNDGHGIFVMWGSNNSVLNNSVTYNAQPGIRIDGTEAQVIIANNTIEYNQPDGIFLYVAYDVLIENNTVSNNKQCGITPQGGSMNTTIRYNLITRNGWHGVFFIGSNNSLVKANIINDNGFSGIELLVSSNDSIVENSITNNTKGIYVYSSSNNSIVGNSVTASNGLGISLVDLSDGNSIVGNQVIANDENGVYLYRSSGNIICGNRVTANVGTGIYLHDSSRQRIFGNHIENNSNGIWLWGSSAYNTIEENTITANIERGIGLYESSDNTIFHNNFVNNIDHVMVYGLGYANHWDNGFEGNYWSDYAGADLNHDGIGDTPYTIDADNPDNYPLMGMFSSFNVTWGDTTWQTEIISNSTITEFTFEQSLKRISFNISGPSGTIGFYRLLIPRALLDGPFTVTVDGISVPYTRWLNVTHTYIYCAHTHSSHQIQITGTTTLPELPEALVPINVQVDVGTIHFKGELAEFYTQTTYEGTAVNATSLEATLYKPDGATELLISQPIALGLHKTTFLIPANASAGTYALVIKATYIKTVGPTTFETTGTSFKTLLLSPTLTNWNAWLTDIKGDVATIKTDTGQIRISLSTIGATLSSINGTIAEISTNIGTIRADMAAVNAKLLSINGTIAQIKTDLGTVETTTANINLKVTAINGTVATIQTTLGTIQGNITSINGNIAAIQTNIGTIKADISAIQGTQETSKIPIYATVALAAIAVIGIALIIASKKRRKETT